jgi:hypothetical protein
LTACLAWWWEADGLAGETRQCATSGEKGEGERKRERRRVLPAKKAKQSKERAYVCVSVCAMGSGWGDPKHRKRKP